MTEKIYLCCYCKKTYAISEISKRTTCPNCGGMLTDVHMGVDRWQSMTQDEQKRILAIFYQENEDWREIDGEYAEVFKPKKYNDLRHNQNRASNKTKAVKKLVAAIATIVVIFIVTLLFVREKHDTERNGDLFNRGTRSDGRVSDAKIASDMYELDSFFKKYNMTIDEIETSERYIDNYGYDRMKLGIYAHNDDCDYHCSYNYVLYCKYDDGWAVMDWNKGGYTYVAKHPEQVTQEQAENVIKENGYKPIELIERREDDNLVAFKYSTKNPESNKNYITSVVYSYSPYDGWGKYEFDYETDPNDPDHVKGLLKDAYPEVNDIIYTYFSASASGDMTLMETVCKGIDEAEKKRIQRKSNYIEKYDDLICYTKAGPMSGSYIVYAYYQIKYVGINTKASGLSSFYVCTDEQTGNLYIFNGELSDYETQFIKEASYDNEVYDLTTMAESEYLNQRLSDNQLTEFIDKLPTLIE